MSILVEACSKISLLQMIHPLELSPYQRFRMGLSTEDGRELFQGWIGVL